MMGAEVSHVYQDIFAPSNSLVFLPGPSIFIRQNMRYFTLCIFCISFSAFSVRSQVCHTKNVANLLNWSEKVFETQDYQRIVDLQNIKEETLDKHSAREKYYELVTKPLQNPCKILKRIGGTWYGGCGFSDGEKLLCMESLYRAIHNGTCLVYSFGLADDWDFEILMAELGCTVHAYDPSSMVERPSNSYHPKIHFHQLGLGQVYGEKSLNTEEGEEFIIVNTLDEIIKANGDYGKPISYLKIDIEGSEIPCIKQWLKSGVMKFVDQLGIEMHTMSKYIDKTAHKMIYRRFITFLKELDRLYDLKLVAYNPNLCRDKKDDSQKLYYSLHDILLVKERNTK